MILVTGSLAFDYIMNFPGKFSDHIMPDKIHQINLSFLVNSLTKQKGGTAGSIAYNLSLLKTSSSILATAGEDFSEYSKFLNSQKIDTSNIKIIPSESTASAFIMTDQADNQITSFYPGAMSKAADLKIAEIGKKCDLVVIGPNDPEAMLFLAEECQKLNLPYLLDPGMQLPRFSKEDLLEMLKGAKILIGNDYEIALFKEKTNLSENQILDHVEILITTLGSQGSGIKKKDRHIKIQVAQTANVVDPTGAGDAYRAGFLAGYLKNLDLKICGLIGSLASCYAVENYGTTNHKYSLEEFKQRFQKTFNQTLNI